MTSASPSGAPWVRPSLRLTAGSVPRTCEVVVVGAGIVGLTTALLLGRAGVDVCVVEARSPGAGTTGRSTAKGTVLQRTRISDLIGQRGSEVAQAYLAANSSGLGLLREVVEGRPDVGQAADAWTFAVGERDADAVAAEARALRDSGLDATLEPAAELPFRTTAAVRLRDQLRLDPMALVAILVDDLEALGVPVVWPARARGVRAVGERLQVVVTPGGEGLAGEDDVHVEASWVVLATLLPFPLRTALFAATTPTMSYAVAGRPAQVAAPSGMYISAGEPTRSLRSIPSAEGAHLLVGGAGHRVGTKLPATEHLAELAEWAADVYGLEVTHGWAAHDYSPADLMPHVGPAPFSPANLLVATGFGKWGMTNGAAAGQLLAGLIVGEPPAWGPAFTPRLAAGMRGWAGALAANAEVGWGLVRGWVADPGSGSAEAEQGAVLRRPGCRPVAVSGVDGVRRTSAVCTHLGGIVRWNDAEQTWDCPLHGSRFAASGSVLTAPAVAALPAVDE